MIGRINAEAIEVLCCLSCGRAIELADRSAPCPNPFHACPTCHRQLPESEKCWKPLMKYHFSLGNSTKGAIGFCTRVFATSKQHAVEKLLESLPSEHDMSDCGQPDIIYLNVYFNGEAISAKDIDDVEPVLVAELSQSHLRMLNVTLENVA
jgi:hypothetical protein